MPRLNLVRSEILPYHVTARVNNKDDFPLPLDKVWEIFCREIGYIQYEFGAEIQAFVLMPNHFHLLITTPFDDLGRVMNRFISEIARSMNRKSGRSGRLFDDQHFRCLIGETRYFQNVYKYVYRNPVRAKLVESPELYPYSTLHGLTGQGWLPFPIHKPRCDLNAWFMGDRSEEIEAARNWLATPTRKEEVKAIRAALQRTVFRLPKAGNARNRVPLEVACLA